MHYRVELQVRDAVALLKDDIDYREIFVRGRVLAHGLRVRELRTKKHDHALVAVDCLGNLTVIDRRGRTFQLIGDEGKGILR